LGAEIDALRISTCAQMSLCLRRHHQKTISQAVHAIIRQLSRHKITRQSRVAFVGLLRSKTAADATVALTLPCKWEELSGAFFVTRFHLTVAQTVPFTASSGLNFFP